MKNYILVDIVKSINNLSNAEGVTAALIDVKETRARGMSCFDIELIYNNYHLVERFNTGMNINDGDINLIAVSLLNSLFHDYYAAKLDK